MARSRSNNAGFVILIILVGLPVLAALKIVDSIGVIAFALLVMAAILGIAALILRKKANRLEYLRNKYGDEAIVQAIIRRQYWAGQSAEQLRDSLGQPAAIDDNLLKTRKREVWKYRPNGVNRYRLRITLDNDVIVAWTDRN